MAEIKILCPHCAQHIQCDESYRGSEINCPTCKGRVLVPEKQQNQQGQSSELPEGRYNHPCPRCGHGNVVDDAWLGYDLKCGGCGKSYVFSKAKKSPAAKNRKTSWVAMCVLLGAAMIVVVAFNFGDSINSWLDKVQGVPGVQPAPTNAAAADSETKEQLDAQFKQTHPSTPPPERITVKGFYIGMPKAEVLKMANERLVSTGVYDIVNGDREFAARFVIVERSEQTSC